MTDISWTVTLYRLFLGDQATTPPYHYQRGYTIHSIEAAIFPEGGAFNFGNLGYHATYNSVAFTEYDLDEGDVLLNSLDQYFVVKSKKKWTLGDQLQFLELQVEELPVFPFLAGFFGFEDEEHGTIGYMFEDGFERGYWAL